MALTTVTGSLVSVNAIQGTLIADNAITAVHIATNAVSGTLIADNAVTAVHIAQNSITVTQLADDCVESDKIADGIITTNHLNKAMISSQTEVSAATGDFVLLGDTSDSNNLKKTPVSSIIGLASGTTINNNADNRIITGSGTANTLEGESGLTYNGSTLAVTGTIDIDSNGGVDNYYLRFKESGADRFTMYENSNNVYLNGGPGNTIFRPRQNGGTGNFAVIGSNVGIGETTPLGKLHIKSGDSAASSVNGNANELVVENSDYTGITILGENETSIMFGDNEDPDVGRIEYFHSTNTMSFRTNGSDAMKIASNGDVQLQGGNQMTNAISWWNAATYELASIENVSHSSYNDSGGLVFKTAGLSNSGMAERMRIDSSGNVGIGATTIDEKLHIEVSSGDAAIKLEDASGDYVRIDQNSLGANDKIRFKSGSSLVERMRITSGGSVLIGTTTTPAYAHKLVCSGSAIPDGTVSFVDTDVSVGLANAVMSLGFTGDSNATSGYFIYMTDGNGAIGSIQAASGTSVSFNTTSDERLKTNIVDASPQLDIIKSIRVREFDWTRNDHHELGLIAQELVEIVPNVVTVGGEDETKNPYGVDYGKLTPYLIKALQEQQALIEAQATTITDLTARIETLENA